MRCMFIRSLFFSFLTPSFLLGQESCVGLLVSAVVILSIGEDNLSQVITSFIFIFSYLFSPIYFFGHLKNTVGYGLINIMIHFSTYLISLLKISVYFHCWFMYNFISLIFTRSNF